MENSATPFRVERYGKYYLLDRIGQGGMAECYRAVAQGAEGFRRFFVLKRILPAHSASTDFVRMFVDEARVCALLNHPNIVQVFEFGEIDGTYFLVMEYLHGANLLKVLRTLRSQRAVMRPALAAHITREVATGIAYAHALKDATGRSRHIVHRDVTPSNVMLLLAGGVKVLDFGIAKMRGEGAGVTTQRGIVKGKFAYLSPEQASSGIVDSRADVFSLGIVFWEMLTGRRLFAGKSDYETLQALMEKQIPFPSTLAPGIDPELDVIAVRALARDKSLRYATAADMARDLESFLHSVRFRASELPEMLTSLFPDELTPGGESAISAELVEMIKRCEAADTGLKKAVLKAVGAPVVAGAIETLPTKIETPPPVIMLRPAAASAGRPASRVVSTAVAARPIRRRGARWLAASALWGVLLSLVHAQVGAWEGQLLSPAVSFGMESPPAPLEAAPPAAPAPDPPRALVDLPAKALRVESRRSSRSSGRSHRAAKPRRDVREAVPLDPFAE